MGEGGRLMGGGSDLFDVEGGAGPKPFGTLSELTHTQTHTRCSLKSQLSNFDSNPTHVLYTSTIFLGNESVL